ncbi:hypothetical protein JL720_16192 [Aureococcus anophagefferens]|nr:hypothetical protein JL720_16192 [Aureococcus anophagefferens]
MRLPAVEDFRANATPRPWSRTRRGRALDGYKVTRLTTRGEDEGAYIAGLWHHDRVGRRLKLFVYLHDVDCDDGHPTLVVRGTHRLRYYRTDSFAASRFEDAYVRGAYDVVAACGRRGGGFLFDTHAVHKGTPERADRTTVIAEFHSAAKCPALEALGSGCPARAGTSASLHRVDGRRRAAAR